MISKKHLTSSMEKCKHRVSAALRHLPATCVSMASATSARNLCLILCFTSISIILPFVFDTLRLDGRKESAASLESVLSRHSLAIADQVFSNRNKVGPALLGFCSNCPNVLRATRELLSWKLEGGSGVLVFAFGCVRHALANCVKDICKESMVSDTFTKAVKIVQLFRHTHVSIDMLRKVRNKLDHSAKDLSH